MSTTYLFDAFVLTQRMNADWSVTTYTQSTGPLEIDPPGTQTGFTLAEWGVEPADINGGSFSFSTPAYGPVTDYLGEENPVAVQVLTHDAGTTTLLRIDRHVRLSDDTVIGFDTILIPISGAALPGFATAEEFATWYFSMPWSDPTETYPVGTEFVWEDFDIDAEPLNGTAGADTLTGTTGDDTINGFGGNDLLRGGRGNDLIAGGTGNDRLEGAEGQDTLNGHAGNDILRGGLGNETDVLNGGTGIDTVDYTDLTMGFQAGGLTVNLNTGTTSGSFYVGQDQLISIENANGTGGADTLIGGAGDNRLRGLAGNDRLSGSAGNDTLEGGTGRDTLIGGVGNDRFITDGLDSITELSGGGVDTAQSSASLTLASNIENLVLTGSANLEGRGNTLANQINGNTGANRLIGGAGNDTLKGYAGADRLEGGTGRDSLIGGDGGDRLIGGAGHDTLTGGNHADVFVFNTALSGSTNVDRITDFSGADRIELETDIFRAIGSTLTASEFRVIASGTSFASVDASDHLIYLKSTGRLYYDADGSGAGARVLFAQLAAGTTLALDDFLMI